MHHAGGKWASPGTVKMLYVVDDTVLFETSWIFTVPQCNHICFVCRLVSVAKLFRQNVSHTFCRLPCLSCDVVVTWEKSCWRKALWDSEDLQFVNVLDKMSKSINLMYKNTLLRSKLSKQYWPSLTGKMGPPSVTCSPLFMSSLTSATSLVKHLLNPNVFRSLLLITWVVRYVSR